MSPCVKDPWLLIKEIEYLMTDINECLVELLGLPTSLFYGKKLIVISQVLYHFVF